MDQYFNDEVYTFAEVDAPVEYGFADLPLETIKKLKLEAVRAVDFIITQGQGRIGGGNYINLVNCYKQISQIYDNMMAVTKYNMMLPEEKERKRLLASGQQVLLLGKPERPALPTTKQEWETQFDPMVLTDDPFKYNFVPTSRIIPPPGYERKLN